MWFINRSWSYGHNRGWWASPQHTLSQTQISFVVKPKLWKWWVSSNLWGQSQILLVNNIGISNQQLTIMVIYHHLPTKLGQLSNWWCAVCDALWLAARRVQQFLAISGKGGCKHGRWPRTEFVGPSLECRKGTKRFRSMAYLCLSTIFAEWQKWLIHHICGVAEMTHIWDRVATLIH